MHPNARMIPGMSWTASGMRQEREPETIGVCGDDDTSGGECRRTGTREKAGPEAEYDA